jgi:hypothetical protein
MQNLSIRETPGGTTEGEGPTIDQMNAIFLLESKKAGYCLCIHPMMVLINFTGTSCAWCLMPFTDQAYSLEAKQLRTSALLAEAHENHPEWLKNG